MYIVKILTKTFITHRLLDVLLRVLCKLIEIKILIRLIAYNKIFDKKKKIIDLSMLYTRKKLSTPRKIAYIPTWVPI